MSESESESESESDGPGVGEVEVYDRSRGDYAIEKRDYRVRTSMA
jgi:hypothetical protein